MIKEYMYHRVLTIYDIDEELNEFAEQGWVVHTAFDINTYLLERDKNK